MLEGQEGVTWPDWLAAAQAAERLGFEAIFTSDHYLSVIRHRDRDRGSSDAWTMLAALAASTETIRLGTMVSPVTFRQPAVLAKAAVTVDRISEGRVEIGMGAGWWEEEHRTHGFPFPDAPTAVRHARRAAGDRARPADEGTLLLPRQALSSSTRHRSRPRACRRHIRRSSSAATAVRGSPHSSRVGPMSSTPWVHRRSRLVSGSAGCGTDSTPTVATQDDAHDVGDDVVLRG